MKSGIWLAAVGVGAALVSLTGGCSDGGDVVATGPGTDEVAGVEEADDVRVEPVPTSAVLDAVIEPENGLVVDFGEGWDRVEQWYEEADVSYATDCEEFNEILHIDNWGGISAIWRNGDRELVQLVADLNWDAVGYLDTVRRLADACPSVTVGSTTISLSALDVAVPDAAGYALSAYPIPDPAAHGEQPDFDPDRTAWVVVVSRDNVVSRLTLAAAAPLSPSDLDRLVEAMKARLDNAPIEAEGPFAKPAPPPRATGTMIGVILTFDSEDCRNDGSADAVGITWALADPVPFDWRSQDRVTGTLTMEGTLAIFAAEDGTELTLSSGAVSAECYGWDDDEFEPEPAQEVDRLLCAPGFVAEDRVPDTGQDPEQIIAESVDGVASVEAGRPLWWWGLNSEGRVIVGLALGDAPGADFQVFSCTGEPGDNPG